MEGSSSGALVPRSSKAPSQGPSRTLSTQNAGKTTQSTTVSLYTVAGNKLIVNDVTKERLKRGHAQYVVPLLVPWRKSGTVDATTRKGDDSGDEEEHEKEEPEILEKLYGRVDYDRHEGEGLNDKTIMKSSAKDGNPRPNRDDGKSSSKEKTEQLAPRIRGNRQDFPVPGKHGLITRVLTQMGFGAGPDIELSSTGFVHCSRVPFYTETEQVPLATSKQEMEREHDLARRDIRFWEDRDKTTLVEVTEVRISLDRLRKPEEIPDESVASSDDLLQITSVVETHTPISPTSVRYIPGGRVNNFTSILPQGGSCSEGMSSHASEGKFGFDNCTQFQVRLNSCIFRFKVSGAELIDTFQQVVKILIGLHKDNAHIWAQSMLTDDDDVWSVVLAFPKEDVIEHIRMDPDGIHGILYFVLTKTSVIRSKLGSVQIAIPFKLDGQSDDDSQYETESDPPSGDSSDSDKDSEEEEVPDEESPVESEESDEESMTVSSDEKRKKADKWSNAMKNFPELDPLAAAKLVRDVLGSNRPEEWESRVRSFIELGGKSELGSGSISQSSDGSAKKTTVPSKGKQAKEPAPQPKGRGAGKGASKPAEVPVGSSAKKPAGASAKTPAGASAKTPAGASAKKRGAGAVEKASIQKRSRK